MPFGTERHHRASIRWRGHDYAAGGTYFVTICTEGRACLLGAIQDGRMWPNALGLIVESEWAQTGVMRPEVEIDVFAVMPNHLHGLVTIRPQESAEGGPGSIAGPSGREQGARGAPPRRTSGSLGSVIAGFKATSTRRIIASSDFAIARVWQRGYYDHLVRDDDDFERIAHYIVTNPERWETDDENPDR
jgi:putative transposase